MDNYFEYKHNCRGINYCYTRKPMIDEREIHSYHEILYYVDGDATFICDSFSQKPSPASLLLIPKGCYHFFKTEDPRRFERLKISFTQIEGFEGLASAMTEVQIFEELDASISALLAQICNRLATDGSDTDRSAFLFGALLILLSSLTGGERKNSEGSRDRLIAATLRYIDSNISKPLDANTLSEAINVSASTLTHTFKQEMGISLHKYVTQKRIALSQRLIADGENPTKIYSECGYGDYSSFYKAYVKFVGHPPSLSESTRKLPKI